MIITRTKSADSTTVNKYCKLFKMPLDGALWGNLYGRHNTIISLKLVSASATAICRYFIGTDNNNLKFIPLDTPIVNIGYIATDLFVDVYANIDVSGAILEVEADNPTLFSPYIKTEINTDGSALTIISRANRTSVRSYVDTANVIKVDMYYRTVGNIVYVDGTIVLRANKSTTGATSYTSIPNNVLPSSTVNMVASSVAGNMLLQLDSRGVVISGTANQGTYVIHSHYVL